MMNDARPSMDLREAYFRLERDGWCQNGFYQGDAMCVIASLYEASSGPKRDVTQGYVWDSIPNNGSYTSIMDWNDSPFTAWSDVQQVFKGAIAHAESDEAQ